MVCSRAGPAKRTRNEHDGNPLRSGGARQRCVRRARRGLRRRGPEDRGVPSRGRLLRDRGYLHARRRAARRGGDRGSRRDLPAARGALRHQDGCRAHPSRRRARGILSGAGGRERALHRTSGLGEIMATDEEIRTALEQVVDPEINLSIIELGLVREIDQSVEPNVVRMLLTTPFCPYAPQIVAQVKEAVTTVTGKPAEVEILPEQWTPEMMPDPGLLGRW